METLKNIKDVVKLFFQRYQFVFIKTEKEIGHIFYSETPASLLFVDVFHCLPKTRSNIGIHRNRVEHRCNPVVAIVSQETLPKNSRVLGDHISLPKINVN